LSPVEIQFCRDAAIKVLGLLLHATFPAAVFTISCNISIREFLRELGRRGLVLRVIAVSSVVTPLITAGMLKLIEVPLLCTGVMLIAAIAPGDSFALLEARKKKGNIPLAASTMVLLCLIMPFTVPIWLWIYSRWFPLHLMASPVRLFAEIAPLTIVPLVTGTLLHEFFPAQTRVLQMIAGRFFEVALLIVSLAAVVLGVEGFAVYTFTSIVLIFIIVSLALVIGYYAGGSERQDRITLGLSCSLGNLAVVLYVAHESYPGVHPLAAAIAFVMIRWAVITFWHLVLKFRLWRRRATVV